MTLQILGGAFKGRRLSTPKAKTTRPTLAILRKAVFDILQDSVQDARVLDLYAGSGAMGFEALSRGASHVTFVETGAEALSVLRKNANTLQVEEQCSIMGYDAFLALKKLHANKRTFDLVYVDPPYVLSNRFQLLKKTLKFFDTGDLLSHKGTLFLEEAAPGSPSLEEGLALLQHKSSRRFSDSVLHEFIPNAIQKSKL